MDVDLQRFVIDRFPYPLARSFRVLLTAECLDAGPERLKQLLQAAETTAAFVGALCLAECRDARELGAGPPPLGLSDRFRQRLARPTLGTWVKLAWHGARWLGSLERRGLAAELSRALVSTGRARPSDATRALESIVSFRNGLSHNRVRAFTRAEYLECCRTIEADLATIVQALRFLASTPVVFVSRIEATKPRRGEPSFHHEFKHLVGHSDDFLGERPVLAQCRDSSAVLVQSDGGSRFLNLDPLLIYEEAAGRAPDLYFLSGFQQPSRIWYSGCKQGGTFCTDADTFLRRDSLAKELTAILTLIGGEENDLEAGEMRGADGGRESP